MPDDAIQGPLTGRNMFIWQLEPIINIEMGINNLVRKAKKAKLSAVWVKIATGASPYVRNLDAGFDIVRQKLSDVGITVWGWHEPRCENLDKATREADVVADLAIEHGASGILMDAEKPEGNSFFQGGQAEANAYASRLRHRLDDAGLSLALCSHDLPQNFAGFPFESFAAHCHVNAPQVYYGASSSVRNRLERAIKANSMVAVPFLPVGAGWVGSGGGCESASACAERALALMYYARKEQLPGYSFWHWGGAPADLWDVLFNLPVTID